MAMCSSGKALLLGDDSGRITLVDAMSGDTVVDVGHHQGPVSRLKALPGSSDAVSWNDKTLCAWDLQGESPGCWLHLPD